MDLQLKDKLAPVTGSTAGIGYAVAEALARKGARVIVNGRTEEAVAATAAKLKAGGGNIPGFAGDLATAEAADELARRHPDVEILVNNLGIYEPKPFEEIPDADWRRLFETNVRSGARLALAYLPAMRRRDWGPNYFHIERKRSADSGGNDPLRHDQDRAARGLARPGGSGRGHRHGHHR